MHKICTVNLFIFIILANFLVLLYYSVWFKQNGMYYIISNLSMIYYNEDNQEMDTVSYRLELSSTDDLPDCPDIPENLVGNISIVTDPVPTEEDLEKKFVWLQPGGHYSPPCKQNQSVAIVVPFRNRPNQLLIFLNHMHTFLKKQDANYTIFIVEQNDTLPFNRGQLMNIGFTESLKTTNFSCFILHDVDLLPEDERIIYRCRDIPVLMSSAIDKYNYNILYESYLGGVVSVSRDLYKKINGFPNRYWGWGGEDDDFRRRFDYHKISRTKNPKNESHYKMLKHGQEKQNPERYKLLKESQETYLIDGLSNLKYNLTEIIRTRLYTRILVNLIK